MATAEARGWGRATAPGFRAEHIITIRAGAISLAVHEDVAPVFRYLCVELAKHYPLAGYADDWGYALRCIRGTGPELDSPSCVITNHAWGLAVDLDATQNPMTRDLKAAHRFVRQLVDPILAPFGGRLVWGGEYVGPRKDYMHFEYLGTRAQATADRARALQLLAPKPAPPVPAPHPITRKAPRMIVRFRSKPEVFEVVGSHLEHITSQAFTARGLKAQDITVLADNHPLSKLPQRA